MSIPWIFRGLRDGVVTTRYPHRPDLYADGWPGSVVVLPVDGDHGKGEDTGVESLCPTGAIGRDETGGVRLDQGHCILCAACVRARPDRFGFAAGAQTARVPRTALVVPAVLEDAHAVARLRADIAVRVRALGQSVHVRHVDAGSDGAEEWEVLALWNPVYDVHRLGIALTASPRHADILLVTGAGAVGMAAPLARTLQAMPDPTVVIAAGTDAVSGGLVSPSYATSGGVGDLLPVDVWVPGSPPSPFSLLHAILLALGRLSEPTTSPGSRRFLP